MFEYRPITPTLLGATTAPIIVSPLDHFRNDGHSILRVINRNVSTPDAVQIFDQTSRPPDHAESFDADILVIVPPESERFIGPFPVQRFNDVNGFVIVQHTILTNVYSEVISADIYPVAIYRPTTGGTIPAPPPGNLLDDFGNPMLDDFGNPIAVV